MTLDRNNVNLTANRHQGCSDSPSSHLNPVMSANMFMH